MLKIHGIKVETVFLPNGLTTLFGPVSARRGDGGVGQLSNLDAFLAWLQHNLFWLASGATWVYYGVFGDSAYGSNRRCIKSYYRLFAAGAPLANEENWCNNAIKAAHMTIKKLWNDWQYFFVFAPPPKAKNLQRETLTHSSSPAFAIYW